MDPATLAAVMASPVPHYKVLENSFFEPNYVLAGSIVGTTASPGPHLEPVNDAAKARMEEWYREPFPEIDVKTKQPTGKTIFPHEDHRIRTYTAGERHQTTVVAAPQADAPTLALPQAAANLRINTDQRPGPAPGHSPSSFLPTGASPEKAEPVKETIAEVAAPVAEVVVEPIAAPEPVVLDPEPEAVAVVQAAPPPSERTAKRIA